MHWIKEQDSFLAFKINGYMCIDQSIGIVTNDKQPFHFLKIFLHSGYGKTFMAMASFPRITFALALALDQLIHYD